MAKIKRIKEIIQRIIENKKGFFTLEVLIGLGIIVFGIGIMTNKLMETRKNCINTMSVVYIQTVLSECNIVNRPVEYNNKKLDIKLTYLDNKLHIECKDEERKQFLVSALKDQENNIIFD